MRAHLLISQPTAGFGVLCVTIKLFDSLSLETIEFGRSRCRRPITKRGSGAILGHSPAGHDFCGQQTFKDDSQRTAARIAGRLREAGYLCNVVESPASPSAPGSRESN
jgi:hypothetical protein